MKFTEKEFLDLYNQGKNDVEIAKKLNCGSTTIGSYRRSLNLPVNGMKIVSDEDFLDLYKKGYNDKQIALITGASGSQISRRRKKYNLPANKSPKTLRLINEFMRLYNQGLSDYKIAEILELSSSRVQDYRANTLKLPPVEKEKVEFEDVLRLYNKGLTDEEIAEVLECSHQHIKRIRLSNGLKREEAKRPNNYKYSDIEYQVILGTVLGDGYLTRQHKNGGVVLSMSHCERQKEYIEWKREFLKENSCEVREEWCHDERFKNPDYVRYSFYTYSSTDLIDFYNRWYLSKKTICKEDFEKIEPLGLAIWYMDDGHKCADGGCVLCTNSFSLEELHMVQEVLKSKFDIDTTIWESCNETYIPAKSYQKFKNLVYPYVNAVKCMQYKLK